MKSEFLSKLIIYISLLIVLIVISWAFILVGSPSLNRRISADRIRISRLSILKNEIQKYYKNNKKLPSEITDLKINNYSYREDFRNDPITKENFDYHILNQTEFKLCAEFALSSEKAILEQSRYDTNSELWKHDEGHYCFKFKTK